MGFETRWVQEIFCATHFSRSNLGTTQPPIQCVTGLWLGNKWAGGGIGDPPQSTDEIDNA
jgi:hypothetical protein